MLIDGGARWLSHKQAYAFNGPSQLYQSGYVARYKPISTCTSLSSPIMAMFSWLDKLMRNVTSISYLNYIIVYAATLRYCRLEGYILAHVEQCLGKIPRSVSADSMQANCGVTIVNSCSPCRSHTGMRASAT